MRSHFKRADALFGVCVCVNLMHDSKCICYDENSDEDESDKWAASKQFDGNKLWHINDDARERSLS